MCTGVTGGLAGVKLSGSLRMCGSFRVATVNIMVTVSPKICFTVKYGWNGNLLVFLFSPSGLFDPVWCRNNKWINPYPTAFPYGNGMVLHFYQQQESSTTKTVHKVINKRLKAYV